MEILSHRGCWKLQSEKNTFEAFDKSFSLGFGTETDIRDLDGELVISHDMPVKESTILTVKDFFSIYKKHNLDLPLALNIKSDGLQESLLKCLNEYQITNYFVFDMSVPDTLGYLRSEIAFFTRESEYEKKPSFYDEANGLWLDEFKSHWIDFSTLKTHADCKKQICIVSPDLHKRPYHSEWEDYKRWDKQLKESKIMLCTDYPEEAEKFFNED
ncbi:PI-PLC domain-containing protein [Pedobacter arcticus]|uniref:hypothetical protein n=1 Tax=Pedobacter arcticus TaxID=752140 RepID=UPI0003150895|nr:hypothetical protein [Pedobacter arcticus]